MNHRATPRFWACYRRLPEEIQQLADRCYEHERSKMRTALILLALSLSAAGCQNESSQAKPEDGNDYFQHAEADRRFGDATKAIANYTEAIRCFSNAHDRMLPAAHFARGLAYYRLGDRADAEKDFSVAESLGYPVGKRPR